MASFAEFVRKYGGTTTEFRQSAWITDVTGESQPDGTCFAFVMAYLMVLRTGGAGKGHPRGPGDGREGQGPGHHQGDGGPQFLRRKDVRQGQLFNLQFVAIDLKRIYRMIGLGDANKARFTQSFYRFTKVGEFLATAQPSYSMIRSRVHIIGAVSRPLADRDAYTFFDPNFGEARFSTGAALVKFTADFFSRKVINKGYRPSKDILKEPHRR